VLANQLQWLTSNFLVRLGHRCLLVKARQGKARQGKARQGEARRGKARQGEARRGKARQGEARRGKARQGEARQGKEILVQIRLGSVRSTLFWHKARLYLLFFQQKELLLMLALFEHFRRRIEELQSLPIITQK
jgi:hypothetical protein